MSRRKTRTETEKILIKENVEWSIYVKICSAIVFPLTLLATGVFSHLIWELRFSIVAVAMLSPFLFVSLYAIYICCANSPISIEISDSHLILNKGRGKVEIKLSDIEELGVYDSRKTIDISIWGVQGVFGFTGLFHNAVIGNYKAYVGSFSQSFYVKTPRKNYMFSCRNRDSFLNVLAQHTNKK